MIRKKLLTAIALLGLSVIILPGCQNKTRTDTGFSPIDPSVQNITESDIREWNGSQTDTENTADDTSKAADGDDTLNIPAYNLPDDESGVFSSGVSIQIGNHTFCNDGLFAGPFHNSESEKKYIISKLEEADDSLHEDVYVFGIGESEIKGEYRLFGKESKNGVIRDDVDMVATIDDSGKYVWSRSYTVGQYDVDLTDIIPAVDIFNKVYDLAVDNEDKMFNSITKKEPISGTYVLKANKDGDLFYEFTINKNSTVRIDAYTGDIIMKNFWNGIYDEYPDINSKIKIDYDNIPALK